MAQSWTEEGSPEPLAADGLTARWRSRIAASRALLPNLAGALVYGTVGCATLAGVAPGALLGDGVAALTEPAWRALAVAVFELVGAVALLDADVSPAASLALSGVGAAAVGVALVLRASTADGVLLLAGALVAVWGTRRGRG